MRCLFIGNGLTRTIGKTDWDRLLDEIAFASGTKRIHDIPLTLEYEHLVNHVMISDPSIGENAYLKTKTQIAQWLDDITLPSNAIHYQIPSLNADIIITTNYDYLIEDAFSIPRSQQYRSNQKYILNYTLKHNVPFHNNPLYFYHPHGVVSSPKSICLGFEHYAGLIQHIRDEINTRPKIAGKPSKMKILQILNGEMQRKQNWPELFYSADISIVGYSMADCEIDIWSLLTHRAYLYYSNIDNAQKLIKNKIVYYSVAEDLKKNNSEEEKKRETTEAARKNKLLLLKSLHVEPVEISLSKHSGSYKSAYQEIFDRINDDWKYGTGF